MLYTYTTAVQITSLKLTNFRNHGDLEINFKQNNTYVVGPNAVGKTNLLEAIAVLTNAKPIRGSLEVELITAGADYTRVEGQIVKDNRSIPLTFYLERGDGARARKRVWVNQVVKSQVKFAGIFQVVIFRPEQIEVLTHSPSYRRKQLDTMFMQYDNSYLMAKRNYDRVVKQRNRLLEAIRESGRNQDTLSYWNDKLLEYGLLLQGKRAHFLNFLTNYFNHQAGAVDPAGQSLKVSYHKSRLTQEHLFEIQDREIAARRTLVGPHLDDLLFTLQGRALADFASRGEQRSTMLLWKMAELDYLQEQTGHRPVLLLDDVFSEFDEQHRENVLKLLGQQQTIVTATDLARIDQGLLASAEIISLANC